MSNGQLPRSNRQHGAGCNFKGAPSSVWPAFYGIPKKTAAKGGDIVFVIVFVFVFVFTVVLVFVFVFVLQVATLKESPPQFGGCFTAMPQVVAKGGET